MKRREFIKCGTMGMLGACTAPSFSMAQKAQKFKIGMAATAWLALNQTMEGYWQGVEAISKLGLGTTEADNINTKFDVVYGADPAGFVSRSKQYGVQLEGVYQALPLHETSKWDTMMEKIRSDGKFLKAAGAKYVAFGWLPPAPVDGKPYVRTSEDVRQSSKTANELGKVLTSEYGISFAFHAERDIPKDMVIQILDETDPKYVKLAADVGHLTAMGLDALQVVKQYIRRLAVCHFKDFDPKLPGRIRPGAFVEVGEGVVDFHGIAALLLDVGFDGWAMIELDRTRKANVSESAQQQISYVQKELNLKFVPVAR